MALRPIRPALPPLAILVAAAAAATFSPGMPPSLSGLTVFGPYTVLVIGVAISVWFNRGRAFIALVSLLAGYAAYELAADYAADPFVLRATYTCIAVFVPLNILIALAAGERGVSHHHNYRWLLIAAAEFLATAWIAAAGHSSLSGTFWHAALEHWLLRSPPMPFLGRLCFALAFALAAARAWLESDDAELRPLDIGLGGALIAFFAGCEWAAARGAFSAFSAAAGLILLVSLLQESHRMAFRDPLTGLPGRRALEESMLGLGPVYTIAMVDVDHFKRFNDTHGHDVGDQVLKLVAARLAGVGGGGTAYRFGGEEFSVLFPNRRVEEALPHLESIRLSIEEYRMAVRAKDRPKDPDTGSQLRRDAPAEKSLSVTVSIGVAEADPSHTSPALVQRSADEALYRAKQSGRNRLSR